MGSIAPVIVQVLSLPPTVTQLFSWTLVTVTYSLAASVGPLSGTVFWSML